MFTSFKQTFYSLFTFHHTMRYLSTLFVKILSMFRWFFVFCHFLALVHRKMWDGLYISGDCIP